MRPLVLLAAASLAATAACGGGSSSPKGAGGQQSAAGPATAQAFTIRGNDRDEFSPQAVAAKVGVLTLTLKNGGVPHNLTFKDSAFPGIATVSGDQTKSTTLTFSKPGTYVFECTIHPGMEGKVVVTA